MLYFVVQCGIKPSNPQVRVFPLGFPCQHDNANTRLLKSVDLRTCDGYRHWGCQSVSTFEETYSQTPKTSIMNHGVPILVSFFVIVSYFRQFVACDQGVDEAILTGKSPISNIESCFMALCGPGVKAFPRLASIKYARETMNLVLDLWLWYYVILRGAFLRLENG